MDSTENIRLQLEDGLREIPMFDAHSHLVPKHLAARGLHDVLFYHMLISDLYAAGCPSGARLTEYPSWPTEEEAKSRIIEALPFLPYVWNTSTAWALRTILEDLYDWREPITGENWKKLDALIREHAVDGSWPHKVLDDAGIDRVATEYARRDDQDASRRFQYVLEWGFFTRTQWGEFDTPLYELERCWGQLPESPTPIGLGTRPATEKIVRTLDEVHAAITYYVKTIPDDDIIAIVFLFSTDIDYRVVTDTEMEDALARRQVAGARERDIYGSYITELFLAELERRKGSVLCQFGLGAEPLPYETGSRVSQKTIGQLGELLARHSNIQFQCFLASRDANQAVCTLARELPNLSLAGYWWHNFFPETVRHIMGERLDMLPVNRQIGFFSDSYSVEWAYAKAVIVRRQLAHVLAERVSQGQYSIEDALAIARSIFWETPQKLNHMKPWDRELARLT